MTAMQSHMFPPSRWENQQEKLTGRWEANANYDVEQQLKTFSLRSSPQRREDTGKSGSLHGLLLSWSHRFPILGHCPLQFRWNVEISKDGRACFKQGLIRSIISFWSLFFLRESSFIFSLLSASFKEWHFFYLGLFLCCAFVSILYFFVWISLSSLLNINLSDVSFVWLAHLIFLDIFPCFL